MQHTPEHISQDQRRFAAKLAQCEGESRSRPSGPKPAGAPKGHEAFLKALESSNAICVFEKISSGEKIEGVIKCSDKYTVSVVSKGQTRVLFKHDISEFFATGRKAQPAAGV